MSAASVSSNASTDPSKTKTIRERYAQRLRGVFGRINATVRERIISENMLHINQSREQQQFEAWLESALSSGLLQEVSPDVYIRSGYERGIQNARIALRQEGADVPDIDIETAMRLPMHADDLRVLFNRNRSQLEGVGDAVKQDVTRVLADGLARGDSSTQIARRINDRVDAIGKARATTLAHTEIINAHTEATLNQFERLGVERVGIQAEFRTANDTDVCPICRSLEGDVYEIDEVRSETFTFEGSTYPIKPPVHPRCRCVLLPVVS